LGNEFRELKKMKQQLQPLSSQSLSLHKFGHGAVPVQAILILAALVLLLPVAMILSGQTTHLLPKASSDDAVVSLVSSSQTMPPNSTFQLLVDLKAHSLVFVHAAVTFDPAKVKLVSEPSAGLVLTRLIQVTPTTEANSTGKFTITIALDPSKKDSVPTGSVNIAGFQLKPVSTKQNDTASIVFDNSAAQFVDKDAADVAFTSQPTVLTLNPGGSSPSPGVTASPSTQPQPTTPPAGNPTCTLSATSLPATLLLVNLKATAHSYGGATLGSYNVIFGDGGTTAGGLNGTSFTYSYIYTYHSAGTYTVAIQLKDSLKHTGSCSTTVKVGG
jgi:hypothetical protein